jgi:hypothetical protein
MQEVLEQTELQSLEEETLPEIHPATDDEILAYLRHSGKIG